jgi:hypothetical protein
LIDSSVNILEMNNIDKINILTEKY